MKIYPDWLPAKTVGQLIKARREEAGLTLRQLAAASGVSASTICRIENEADFEFSALCQLCQGLRIEVHEFIGAQRIAAPLKE